MSQREPRAWRERLGVALICAAIGLLAAGIFALDLWSPGGVAFPYVAVILAAYWKLGRRGIAGFGLLCGTLSVLAYFLTPTGAELGVARGNLGLSLFAIAVTTSLAIHRRHSEVALAEANRELQRARLEAEEANRFKSGFIALTSHEIRTPLTAVLGFAESLLERDVSEAERRDAIRTILANGEHLLQLVNDVLDLSKIESGQLEIEQIEASPFAVVEQVAEMVRGRAEEKQLDFEIDYATPLPAAVVTDATRLRQILLNLLGNAIKFTEKGGVRLEVLFRPAAVGGEPPAQLAFRISDTGIGMDPADVERLFRPFTQAGAPASRRHGGTGLGLTISRHLAERLGGSIRVESEPDVGSCFEVWVEAPVPRGAAFVTADEARATRSSAPQPAATPAEPLACSVLVAEDVRANQLLVERILSRAGARVTLVGNGEQAVLAALRARDAGAPFDLVLMDMQMPVMDGLAATRRLREREYAGPIVALTASAFSSDRDACFAAGCDDVVTKPIDRSDLLARLRALLRR